MSLASERRATSRAIQLIRQFCCWYAGVIWVAGLTVLLFEGISLGASPALPPASGRRPSGEPIE